MRSTEEQQRKDKDTVGLVIDDNNIVLFAVGDLRSNLASKADPAEDEDDEEPELSGQDVYMRPPVVNRTFRGYHIIEPDEMAHSGKEELYAMGEDHHLPEIALDLGPIEESRSTAAVHNEDFKMGSQRRRHVSPGLDFYRPQLTSRRLGDVRGDVPRMRSVVPAGPKRGLVVDRPAGYSQRHKGQDLLRRAPNVTTGRTVSVHQSQSTSRLAKALREEELIRPVVKFREYPASEGPVDGPSNEVFLTPEEVEARRRQGLRRQEDKQLEEEAKSREEAKVKYHHY